MKKKLICLIFSIVSLSVFVFADDYFSNIPDSSDIRTNLIEEWFESSLNGVRTSKPTILYNEIGEEFQVRLEEDDSTYKIFVAPHSVIDVDVYSDKGKHTERQDVYPGDIEGSWVLIKNKKDDRPLRIRYYFKKDSDVYIQFSPNGKTSLADMVIFDNYAVKGASTGVPFSTFYEASLNDAINITKDIFPWKYVKTFPDLYHSSKQMCAVIKEKLPSIEYTEDAMIDENNNLVHISTGKAFIESEIHTNKLQLSSAGFVKWIADGLVEPIAGGKLKRSPLITETVNVKDNGRQGVLSQIYDLYFSLNWVRNLSSGIISVYTGRKYLYNKSGVDVKINPFASTITPNGIINTVAFIEDSGYSVMVLKSLLYVLASSEPDNFFIGAIRGTDQSVSPEIKAFNECVAFFPYFETDGSFFCNVFINGRLLSLDDFLMIYGGDFVYLTKVRSSEQFFPD